MKIFNKVVIKTALLILVFIYLFTSMIIWNLVPNMWTLIVIVLATIAGTLEKIRVIREYKQK